MGKDTIFPWAKMGLDPPKLYLQLVGLFMGCKVSPLLAIIRVYTFEKRVLYVDQHYISVPYGRYVDDAYIIASSLEEAECMFNQISEMDPDNRLQWEIEFPDSDLSFIPFLGTQIQVESTNISYKF